MANNKFKPYKPKKKKPVEKKEAPQVREISKVIQWFPGHMTKAKRQIAEDLSLVDVAIELCDARIPISSRNPQIDEILSGKPSILVLNKASLADPESNMRWKEYYKSIGREAIFTDWMTGEGISDIIPAVREVMKDKLERFERKGMVGRLPRALIIGITNAGKSTLVNKLSGTKRVKAEDRPGVTRENQWVSIKNSIELLDTPGILWPKFEDERTGLRLAFTGAIRDEILDREEIAVSLCKTLYKKYPKKLCERYKLDPEELEDLQPYEIFELIGRKRGFLIAGGEIDYARTAVMLLDEFRGAKIGRLTLEEPQKSKETEE